jgi:hypothetical protein
VVDELSDYLSANNNQEYNPLMDKLRIFEDEPTENNNPNSDFYDEERSNVGSRFSPVVKTFDKYLQSVGHIVTIDTYCGGGNGNIWCSIPYSSSVYNTYVNQVRTGGKLSTYYLYSDQCINSFTAAASDIFYYYQNRTGFSKSPATAAPAPWQYQMFNITAAIGTDYADTLYYCYLFQNSVE